MAVHEDDQWQSLISLLHGGNGEMVSDIYKVGNRFVRAYEIRKYNRFRSSSDVSQELSK